MITSKLTKGEKVMTWVGIFLIFMPKINLISINGQSAGLRIDDFLLFFVLVSLLFKIRFSKLSGIETSFLCLLGFWISSNIFNIIFFNRSNFLYSLRYLEYFLFFYVGIFFSKKYNLHTFLIYIVAINGIVIILQLLGLLGGFASEGMVTSISDRAIGLTGGPWEIAAILNFCFAIYSLDTSQSHSTSKILLFYIVTLILILLTGSRIPLAAHIVLLIMFLYNRIKNKLAFLLYAAIISLVITGIFLTFSDIVVKRSENVMSSNNVEIFTYTYKRTIVKPDFTGFPEFDVYDNADLSWLMRVTKWTYSLKLWLNSPTALFLGVGPGTWGIALDGGILRLITETGLIGTLLFGLFLKKCTSVNYCVKAVIIALIINMVMIDIHIAYKSMALIFMIVGYFFRNKYKSKQLYQAV